MDELAKVVSEKTGLTIEQSKAAAQAVIDYITAKLPVPVAAQVKELVKGGGATGAIGDTLKGFGLGKK